MYLGLALEFPIFICPLNLAQRDLGPGARPLVGTLLMPFLFAVGSRPLWRGSLLLPIPGRASSPLCPRGECPQLPRPSLLSASPPVAAQGRGNHALFPSLPGTRSLGPAGRPGPGARVLG